MKVSPRGPLTRTKGEEGRPKAAKVSKALFSGAAKSDVIFFRYRAVDTQWGTADAEERSPFSRDSRTVNILSDKPGVGRYAALSACPAASYNIISSVPVHSASFLS